MLDERMGVEEAQMVLAAWLDLLPEEDEEGTEA